MSEKILIIDDDVDTLKLVGLMLQRQGYQISAASNGEQGLAKAFAEKPDVILLDLMMPDMDGYEVTRRLRKNQPTKSTPDPHVHGQDPIGRQGRRLRGRRR